MSNRGDMDCFHEPYNEAFYYGHDRRHDRYFLADKTLQPTAGLTIASTHDRMLRLAADGRVFIKDFAYSIIHMADDRFLDAFTHTFLIRDPAKVITSMHSRWPDISLAEIGFEDLHTLFNRVADREGRAPVVVDSDELLQSPQTGMQRYCEAVGIPYLAAALNWEQKAGENQAKNATWNTDEHGFHDSLKASSGLGKQKRDYPPLDSSADMLRLYEASLPHYSALKAHKLTLTGQV
jgi:adenylylsulfate kinase